MKIYPCLLSTLLACSGADDTTNPVPTDTEHETGTTTKDTTTHETGTTPGGGALAFDGSPTLAAGGPNVPLVRRLSVCADTPEHTGSTIVATLTADDGHVVEARDATAAACHAIGVFGLKSDREYCMVVTASAPGRDPIASDEQCFRTAPLPADFPQVTIRRNDKAKRAQGVLFTDLGANPITGPFYFVALDQDLDVIWIDTDLHASAFELLPNGHLLVENGDIFEVDLYGTVVQVWTNLRSQNTGVPIAAQPFHHEVHALDDGTIATLSTVSVPVTDYPSSYTNPNAKADANVRDQTLVRFDPAGNIVQEVSMGDLLDLHRIGYDSLALVEGGYEWGHANAATRTPEDDGWIVSLRHQDALVEFDDALHIRWILGTHANWGSAHQRYLLSPVGSPFSWTYHQHAPEVDADRTLRVFDNHNAGVSPYETAPVDPTLTHSRCVQYKIDPVAKTVRQEWEYWDLIDGPVFAYARGDCDKLPNGNVLTLFPTIVAEHGVMLTDEGKAPGAVRLIELSLDPDPTPIMDIEFWSDPVSSPSGWYAYRSKYVADPPWNW